MVQNQCFTINDHFDHEFEYRTYLELKGSDGALDCLNITSVSLLGCSFMARLGPWSLIFDPLDPDVPASRSNLPPSSLILDLDPWSLNLDPWSLMRSLILDPDPWSLITDPWSDPWTLILDICRYMSLYAATCRYMSLYVAIRRYMSLYVGVCPCIGTDSICFFWCEQEKNS